MSLLRRQFNRLMLRYRYRLERTHKPDLFAAIFNSYLERNGRMASFVQIGANDGIRFDPLNEFTTSTYFDLSGLVVEPVPRYFRSLQENYSTNPKIVPVNVAIHNMVRETSLFVVDERYEKHLPEWVMGIASFSRSHLVRPELPDSCIQEITVPCMSLTELLRLHELTKLDLLQIDAEGYDSEIIRSIDFSILRPTLIHFEHGLRDGVMNDCDFREIVSLLNRHGYQVLVEQYDALAIQHGAAI